MGVRRRGRDPKKPDPEKADRVWLVGQGAIPMRTATVGRGAVTGGGKIHCVVADVDSGLVIPERIGLRPMVGPLLRLAGLPGT